MSDGEETKDSVQGRNGAHAQRGADGADGAHAAKPGDPWPRRSPSAAERSFLRGPQRRLRELGWALGILFEFIRGFRRLHFAGPCVTVFGSARFPESHPYYELGRATGAALAQAGFTVMTGGGPGIMEAANRGAREAGGRSIGVNIVLPREQRPNPYLDLMIEFRHFFVRKVMLLKYSFAFVALPGGLGTMDEVFETLTLIQTQKMTDFPVVLMGRTYWQPLLEWLEQKMVAEGTIAVDDLGLMVVTDSPAEALQVVLAAKGGSMVRQAPPVRPSILLGESEVKAEAAR